MTMAIVRVLCQRVIAAMVQTMTVMDLPIVMIPIVSMTPPVPQVLALLERYLTVMEIVLHILGWAMAIAMMKPTNTMGFILI